MSPFLASVAAGSVKGFRSAGGAAIWEIVDSVYVYNGGTIYGISDIPNAALDLLPNNSVFMIRYELYVYGGTQTITARHPEQLSAVSVWSRDSELWERFLREQRVQPVHQRQR